MGAMVLANPSNSIFIGTVFYAIYHAHQANYAYVNSRIYLIPVKDQPDSPGAPSRSNMKALIWEPGC